MIKVTILPENIGLYHARCMLYITARGLFWPQAT